jgi:hypothetical protein
MKRGLSCALVASVVLGAALSYSCAKTSSSSSFDEDSGASSGGSGSSSGAGASGSGSGGAASSGSSSGGGSFFDGSVPDVIVPPGSDGGTPVLACPMPSQHNDFAAPVIDMGAPANSAALFAAADVGTDGPCMYEPESGALFPNNWIRMRFRFTTTHQENLFEIKLVVPNETTPLVIYTTANPYTLHALAWQAITTVGVNQPIVVSVRSAVVTNGALTGGPWAGTTGGIEIAPVPAAGSVVYWTTSNNTLLKGFQMGNESPPQPVLAPTQLSSIACIGCHTSTPDGDFVGVTVTTDKTTGDGPAFIDIRSADGGLQQPSFATPSAMTLLSRKAQHAPAFSPGHWKTGDRVVLTMYDQQVADTPQIAWTNLEATGQTQGTDWDFLPRNGDNNPYAGAATFSHDGTNVAYESSMETINSGITVNDSVLYVVPFNGGKGGTASPLKGADDAKQLQYYPAYSHDDQFIAFNRAPATATGGGLPSSYSNQDAEVFVVPASGGTSTRLAANDPPACLKMPSPGVQNSWPKWSPQVFSACGSTYYFLVFSSTRDPMSVDPATMMTHPQLYVAPIVVGPGGVIKTYSALYLWNQPEAEHNHTPAWDNFDLPPPPPMPPPPQ